MDELTPASIAPPFARYAHGVLVPEGRRLIFTSGQLGLAVDGTIPDDVGAQAEICFAAAYWLGALQTGLVSAGAQAEICFGNIDAILAEGGAGRGDVVRINAFVIDRAHMAAYMAARDRWLADVTRLPASTLVIVSGFTRAEFKVEIEVVAAV